MPDKYLEEIINPGDRASRLAKEICFKSHGNCPAVIVIPHQPNNFRGSVGFVWKKFILDQMMDYRIDEEGRVVSWAMLEEVENDGAGGKPQFFTLLGDTNVFFGLGWEIITMNADDFARSGRFPAVIANEINAKQINDENFPLFKAMMEGYGRALGHAAITNITGETAIMRHSITAFCDTGSKEQLILTWGGTCIGLARKDLLVDGSKIKPGMTIVGFLEEGYRCNGGTFFVNLIQERWGSNPKKIKRNLDAINFVQQLTRPSHSYARTITRIVGWQPYGGVSPALARIYGIAHITGGGVWGKLKDVLPEGIGANLSSMPEPPPVLLTAQRISFSTSQKLSDWQAYSTFHGGCGMLLVCHANDAEIIVKEANKDGIRAQVVGATFASDDREIIIQSKFKEGKQLSSKSPS